MSPLIDTLRAARRLENAGFGSAQAEAIVTLLSHAETRLATKDDIERVEKSIEGLRTGLTAMMDAKIAELRVEMNAMMNRQAVVFVAVAGLLFVALRFT